jgi:tetratricopeptide (TPR) repeat protein
VFALESMHAPVRALLVEPNPAEIDAARVAIALVVAAALWFGAARLEPGARGFLRRAAWAAALSLVPVLNLLPQETAISERFLYLSSGFALAPAGVLVAAAWRRGGNARPAVAGVFALAMVLLIGISAWRARAWRDDVVLWRIAVQEEPERAAFWDRLGLALTERRDFGAAEDALRRAVALDPKSFNALVNLGVLLHSSRRSQEAIEVYRKALEIDARNVQVHLDLGLSYLDSRDFERAYEEFRTAVALKPDNPDALRLAGGAALQLDKLEDARRYLVEAERLLPRHPAIQQAMRMLEQRERERVGAQSPSPAPSPP